MRMSALARVRTQPGTADLQVFFEAVRGEQIAQFERADVAASGADFLLQIRDDPLQVGESEAGLEELAPKPDAIKAQGELLAGVLAVEGVGGFHGEGKRLIWHGSSWAREGLVTRRGAR